MELIGWVYLAGAVVTMGMAIAVTVKKHDNDLEIGHLIGVSFCGAIWPVLWCALAAYVILYRE